MWFNNSETLVDTAEPPASNDIRIHLNEISHGRINVPIVNYQTKEQVLPLRGRGL